MGSAANAAFHSAMAKPEAKYAGDSTATMRSARRVAVRISVTKSDPAPKSQAWSRTR